MDASSMDSNMPGMTMAGSAPTNTADAVDALSTAGLDMSNVTVQSDFLAQLLDDTELQVIANSYARYFWYGVVVVIALAALLNIIMRAVSRSRQVTPNSIKCTY
jgi:ferric-chelate reductase